ncbi:S9 family peptidase [Limnothrix sp. FACHB-708]|nr:S9 family peptidase [Limnothrix sp. FACHB-708]MBD2589483.1 S9 family peptidase [Limnothrix sp. FACHB-406]
MGWGWVESSVLAQPSVKLPSVTGAARWQPAPPPIDQMLKAPATPIVMVSPNRRYTIELLPVGMAALVDLAAPALPLAGLRINPQTNGPSLGTYYRGIIITELSTRQRQAVSLPANSRLSNLRWSRDGRSLALTQTTDRGLELWVIDLETASPRMLTGPILNGAYGSPCDWLPGTEGLVCKVIPTDRGAPPPMPVPPEGPIIEDHDGQRSPNRTYTNLLNSPHDEALLRHYLSATIEQIDLQGRRSLLLPPDLYDHVTPSPNGQHLLVETVETPFSYKVPIDRFPRRIALHHLNQGRNQGNQGRSQILTRLPLADNLPLGFDAVRPGKRLFGWRTDRPATLYWVEALDGGNPGQAATDRDALYVQEATALDQPPQRLWQSSFRFRYAWWGNGNLALIEEFWFDERRVRLWQVAPDRPGAAPVLRGDRNYQDRYRDPGDPLMAQGPYGLEVLRLATDQQSLYLVGQGASPQGIHPFLDRWNLVTNQTERLWQATDPYYEYPIDLLSQGQLLTQRQSQREAPNYFLRNLASSESPAQPLTQFADPIPALADIQQEIVYYQRADGVPLSATLYLPPGYERDRDGPLPMVFWVYPEEYADRNTAGQVTTSANFFSRPEADSPLFLLALGYGVLLDPSLPIVGENGAEPNDTYIEQLIAGAEAAVNYVVDRGIADPKRLLVGGHSYGAFTVANLLAHTNLFRAGIARSGAYNRTLTPFGFQGEQRTYWQAQETYTRLSPFTFADRINEPLLLIHGQRDSNPGTYPIQSERMYDAMRGLGGTARLVLLPYEDHAYESQEAIGHVLWEMARWCDLYIGTSTVQRLRMDFQQAHAHP